MAKTDFKTIDEYIATFDADAQVALGKIRTAIRKAAPDAEEVISYQIPAYKSGKTFVIYFSGFTGHYSLAFPPPFTVFTAFAKELAPYKQSKSVVQLPKDSPLPLDLISRMVKFRLEEAQAGGTAAPARQAASSRKAPANSASAKAAAKTDSKAKTPAKSASAGTKAAPNASAKAKAPAKAAGKNAAAKTAAKGKAPAKAASGKRAATKSGSKK
ncbi:iron chaperone [Chitinophaga sp.]|uniref:iron chaperone n=1 Tax=Chitinophaga sp. TaxID=1869181 RepID=UPI00261197FE|nr:DUF1801 domain-containing protein [uncultured Chitinophaga sp.]